MIALAFAFERSFANAEERVPVTSAREIIENNFGAINSEDFERLKTQASFVDELPDEMRENWREMRLDKIRRRGASDHLDANLNPSHITEVLSREPRTVQDLILRNLSSDLSRRIALYLDLPFIPEKAQAVKISDEITQIVKRKFLSSFLSIDDVYEPDALDNLSVDGIDKFIYQLGLREIAIACRGISSKETLAAFLNRFSENDAREIALYITELDKIRPFWVAQADALVRKSWNSDLPPERVIKKIGFKLLAIVFAHRDEIKINYAAQKLSIRDVKNWQRLVNVSRKKYYSAMEEDRQRLEKRRRIIERLALKFAETGRL